MKVEVRCPSCLKIGFINLSDNEFKKMLDDDQIDQNIYHKISDLLLARCSVLEKSQESQKKTKI